MKLRTESLLCAALLAGCETIPPDLDFDEIKCAVHQKAAEKTVADIWRYDLPALLPIWEHDAITPEIDQAYCRKVVEDLGVAVTYGPKAKKTNTALFDRIELAHKFETYTEYRQAAIMCHEAMHILGQHRLGVLKWGVPYTLTWYRLASEGTAYAVYDEILARYDIVFDRERRARTFPEIYAASVSGACVEVTFDLYLDQLRGML